MDGVSVVLPTYNRADTLPRAIDSVLSQSVDVPELLVVDDRSTDDTAEVVSRYGDPVRYIRHEENRGAPAARNTGIEMSEYDFIGFIDSDDEWHETKLEKQLNAFEQAGPSVGAVYTGFIRKEGELSEIGVLPSKRGDIFEAELMKDWVNPTSTVLVRANCFDTVGLFDTDLAARQDYDMWIRLAREFEFDYVKEPLVTMYADSSDRITDNVNERMRAHRQLLDKIEDDIQSLDFVSRRLAWGYQYYTMGRYAQRMRHEDIAQRLLLKSIRYHPLHWKTFVALAFCMLDINTENRLFLSVKNLCRRILS